MMEFSSTEPDTEDFDQDDGDEDYQAAVALAMTYPRGDPKAWERYATPSNESAASYQHAVDALREITNAPGQREFLCALEGEICNCVGKVYYGHGRTEFGVPQLADLKAHRRTEVHAYGTVDCENAGLCQDPASPGYEFYKKACYCDGRGIEVTPTSSGYTTRNECCCSEATGGCSDAVAGPVSCGSDVFKISRSSCSGLTYDSAFGLSIENRRNVKLGLGISKKKLWK